MSQRTGSRHVGSRQSQVQEERTYQDVDWFRATEQEPLEKGMLGALFEITYNL